MEIIATFSATSELAKAVDLSVRAIHLSCGSEVSAATLALPVAKASRLEALDLEAILLGDVILLVGKLGEALHHVVPAIVVLPVRRQVLELQVLFLLQHGVWVDVRHDLLLLELRWVHVQSDFGFLKDGRLHWLTFIDYALVFIFGGVELVDLGLHETHPSAATLREESAFMSRCASTNVLL